MTVLDRIEIVCGNVLTVAADLLHLRGLIGDLKEAGTLA